ncbi:MAG: hypothetical protein HYT29_02090 [Parcubacteria group bacterium]|nr:hypothetical protein [Parcubacteria group bacterium]
MPLWHSGGAKRPAARELRMEIRMLDSHTKGLRIWARQNTLTETDWFNLLEERRTLLEPHLREMTLKALGDLKIVNGDHQSRRSLRMGRMVQKVYHPRGRYCSYWVADELKAVEGHFPLETRGIFPDDDIYYHGHFKWDCVRTPGRIEAVGEILKFWGLTRNNQWIKAEATVRFFTPAHVAKHDERPEQIREVQKLIVSESTPSEICQFCGVTPRWIWQRLGDVAQEWVTHRRQLLLKAEQLAEVIKQENALADIVAPQ